MHHLTLASKILEGRYRPVDRYLPVPSIQLTVHIPQMMNIITWPFCSPAPRVLSGSKTFIKMSSLPRNSYLGLLVSASQKTPWAVAHQVPWSSPGKNTGVSCQEIFFYLRISNIFLQGIFPDQGLNPHPLHWQVDSLTLGHLGTLRNKRLNQGTTHLHHPN